MRPIIPDRTALNQTEALPLVPDADVYADRPVALTIYDSGGDDKLDMRWDNADQRVDLRPEGISDVLGLTGNLVIARGTIIETFVAGSGDDAVTGNDANNHLYGCSNRPSGTACQAEARAMDGGEADAEGRCRQ